MLTVNHFEALLPIEWVILDRGTPSSVFRSIVDVLTLSFWTPRDGRALDFMRHGLRRPIEQKRPSKTIGGRRRSRRAFDLTIPCWDASPQCPTPFDQARPA